MRPDVVSGVEGAADVRRAGIGGQPMTRKLPSATIAVNGRNVDI